MSSEGVLPAGRLRKALADGWIRADAAEVDSNVQPASLDLRLGNVAYRLRCSFLPGSESVRERLTDFAMEEIDLRTGAILEKDRPYLIPLDEELSLPDHIRGRTNPKSSTGRVDVFCRVITDHSARFDEIRPGYEGQIYLEVFSRSFTIKVRTALALNQLRLVAGTGTACSDAEVRTMHAASPILFAGDEPVPDDSLTLADGLFLGVDLTGRSPRGIGYRAKRNSKLLDLSQLSHDPDNFWEPVYAEPGDRLVLEPEEFYLLISSERVRIPPTHAAEMEAYDPTAGELRTHYAGFFDPGFGHNKAGPEGTRAVLEVRARDVPFILEDGQSICKLVYEPVVEEPEVLYGKELGSNYHDQELTLSKHFRVDGRNAPAGRATKPESAVSQDKLGFEGT